MEWNGNHRAIARRRQSGCALNFGQRNFFDRNDKRNGNFGSRSFLFKKDITKPLAPIALGGNLKLQVDMTDTALGGQNRQGWNYVVEFKRRFVFHE